MKGTPLAVKRFPGPASAKLFDCFPIVAHVPPEVTSAATVIVAVLPFVGSARFLSRIVFSVVLNWSGTLTLIVAEPPAPSTTPGITSELTSAMPAGAVMFAEPRFWFLV